MSTIIQRNASGAGADLPQHQQQQPAQSIMGTQTPQRRRRRIFHICGLSYFRVPRRMVDAIMTTLTTFADGFIYLLGPFLIAFASVIISGLAYTYFFVLAPMMERANAKDPWCTFYTRMHTTFVCFLLTNVVFNYVACVTTSNKGEKFDRVVRELADATAFTYPETPEEVVQAKRHFEDRMMLRMQRRQARAQEMAEASAAGGGSDPPAPLRGWMIMGPHEWGFCNYTGQPKPPRSHYDHVTKMLVLNMDHFCPWMFNTVGYFNYRYFCNFLFFVLWGMIYGTYISYRPFREISSPGYWKRMRLPPQVPLDPWIPSKDERTPIMFAFMLCLSIGIAVLLLSVFHAYLLFTSQTTIEFHGNWANMRRAKKLKKKWRNPYDLGLVRNFQQVYGMQSAIFAVMIPSLREPEFLPVPMPGDMGRRHPKSKEDARDEETLTLINGRDRDASIV